MQEDKITVLLLDIEGTTTPKDFVYKILFPYAREHFQEFLEQHFDRGDIQADLSLLKKECAEIQWQPGSAKDQIESAMRCVVHLMDLDRKSTGLKSLQGKIWEEGYSKGELQGAVYPDVPRAFTRWHRQGRKICIYSSGSIQAQKLLFSLTTAGDLATFIARHFDTTTGPKTMRESFIKIARSISVHEGEVLFVSDSIPELDAASSAGMEVLLCVREEDETVRESSYEMIRTFDEIFPAPFPPTP